MLRLSKRPTSFGMPIVRLTDFYIYLQCGSRKTNVARDVHQRYRETKTFILFACTRYETATFFNNMYKISFRIHQMHIELTETYDTRMVLRKSKKKEREREKREC